MSRNACSRESETVESRGPDEAMRGSGSTGGLSFKPRRSSLPSVRNLDALKELEASKVDGVPLPPAAHRILAMEIKKIMAPILATDTRRAK
jgi:hypothetical protein